MKKKILFVIDSLRCGGAEKSLINTLKNFNYDEYDVYLQMFSKEGVFLQEVPKDVKILDKIKYLEYCKQKKINQLTNFKNYKYLKVRLSVAFHLRINKDKNLNNEQIFWAYANKAFEYDTKEYDVAIAWGQGRPIYYIADKVNAIKKIAFINADCLAAGYNIDFDQRYFTYYNYIVGVSDILSNKIKSNFPLISDRIRTIYDLINVDDILEKSNVFIPEEFCDKNINIITVGRLVQEKGYDMAIEACSKLVKENNKIRWYVVGNGPDRNRLDDIIQNYNLQEHFILLGEKNNPYPYIKFADIYVQSSRHEGYCITLHEARILNKPIVTTNFNVVYNQIKDKKNGLIVEMTGESIYKGINKLLNDEQLKVQLINELKKEKKGNISEIKKLYELF